MGLFGWFSKTSAPAQAPSPQPVAPAPAIAAPPPSLELNDSPFGGAVAVGISRYLQSRAADMRSPGDRQYVALLLRAARNDGVEIPTMPGDLMEIQRLLSSPDSDIADLAKAVQRDPSIAAKFISVANSPMYRGVRSVGSVRDALVRIGLNHAGMILLAIVSSSKLFRVPGYQDTAKWLHRHSLSTAIIAQYFARQLGLNEQDAFLSGLLHDLGRVFLLSQAHEVWRGSKGEMKPDPETVRELSEALHASFSALTAQLWNYPEPIVSVLQHHHLPETGGELVAMSSPEHRSLTRVVAIANLIDHIESEDLSDAHPALAGLLEAEGLEADDETLIAAKASSVTFLQDLGVKMAPRPD